VFKPEGGADFDVSDSGSLLYAPGSDDASVESGGNDLVWLDRSGRETAIPVQTRPFVAARLSPDGTRAALDARGSDPGIWIWDFGRQRLSKLTLERTGLNPVWAPDGNDIAFAGFQPPRNTTVPQTFTFDPADQERAASLTILVGSVHDPSPIPNPSGNQKNRPNVLQVETGGQVTRLADPLGDREPEWDSGTVEVTIPAGATSLTVSYLSEYDQTGDLPASLVWLAAALSVPTQPPAPVTTTTPTTAPPTTAPAPTTSVVSQPATTATTVVGQREIPITGTESGSLLAAAAVLVAAGGVTILAARRRTAAHHR